MRDKKNVTWEKPREQAKEERIGFVMEAVGNVIAMLLFGFASIFMLCRVPGVQDLKVGDDIGIGIVVALMMGVADPLLRVKLSSLGEEQKKLKLLIRMGVPCFSLFAILIHFAVRSGRIITGTKALIARYVARFNVAFKTDLVYAGGNEGNFSSAICFWTLAFFFVSFALFYVGRKKRYFVLYPALCAFLIMFVGLPPSWDQISFVLIGIYLISREWMGKLDGIIAAISAGVLCVTCFLVGMIFTQQAEDLRVYVPQAKDYQSRIEKAVTTLYYKAAAPLRRSVNNAKPKYHDAKVMTIRFDDKPSNNLYFKNYVGVNYKNGAWKTSASQFKAACEENDTRQSYAARILASALGERLSADQINYSVKYTLRATNSMLLPYGTNAGAVNGARHKGELFTQKSYLKWSAKYQAVKSNVFGTNDIWAVLENANNLDPEEEEFWDWYGRYVEETYLSVPEYVWDLEAYREISSLLREVPASQDKWRMYVAETVSDFLRSNYVYSWDLDKIGNSTDPIQYFLEEGGEGYCIHFATAGVELLRAVGVPARYVSGYVLKPLALKERKDGTWEAKVIDRNEHAWVEIYLDKVGWIPVEMTPGYERGSTEDPTSDEAEERRKKAEQLAEQEEQTPEEDKATTDSPGETTNPDAVNQPQGNANGGGSVIENVLGSDVNRSITRIIAGIALLVVLVIAIIVVRRAYARRLNDAIDRLQYRRAIFIMNRQIFHGLKLKHGIKSSRPTDRDYERELLKLLGEGRKNEIEEFFRIANKAKFSDRAITKEDCESVRRFYATFY